jgi:hypothetical protein
MRFLTLLLFVSTFASAQDCTTLNNFTSFHGFKFGEVVPDTLRELLIQDKFLKEDEGKEYYQDWETAKVWTGAERTKPWYQMGGMFDEVRLHCANDNMLYMVSVKKQVNLKIPFVIGKSALPKFYSDVLNQLTYTFGSSRQGHFSPSLSQNRA